MPIARFASATFAPMQAVVERNGAAVDLDVVERELRRRRVRRLEECVDQVLDVVRAVRVAHVRDGGAGQAQRVEHRRKPPQRRRRNVDVERVEMEQRLVRLRDGEA
jgi:hypothetical protein